MKKLLALTLVLVMAIAMFAGCQPANTTAPSDAPASDPVDSPADEPADEPTDEPADEPADAPAAAGGEVIINLGSEPPEMNSILTTSTGSMNVLRHAVEGLTILDANDEPAPGMATDWTISDDGMTYTFNLRQGQTWSNGEPVTAHDFIYAWDTHFTAETAAQYASTWAVLILGANEKLNGTDLSADDAALLTELGYENGVGFKAVDDYTIQVTTTNPYPYFLSVLAFPSLMPMNEKAYTEIGFESYGTEADKIVTNGAFNIVSWAHESEIVLEKNPNYWNAENIKLDKITMLMIADSGTALNAFKAGEIDMIGLNGEQAIQIKDEGEYEVLQYNDGSAWYFEYNVTQKGLNNKKVRQALTLAIDAESFVKNVVKNNSTVAYSFTPPAISNGTFTAEVGQLITRVTDDNYDAVKALLEEGLAEEGMTAADLKIAIVTDEGDTAARNCAFFQEQWKTHLGVEVSVEQMTYKNRLERMTNKDFSVVMAGWGPDYNDPMSFMDLWITDGGNNHTSWSNAQYDQYIADAIKETDAAARTALLIEAEKLLMDEMPIGPIYNRARDYVCSAALKGVVRTTFSDIDLRYAYLAE